MRPDCAIALELELSEMSLQGEDTDSSAFFDLPANMIGYVFSQIGTHWFLTWPGNYVHESSAGCEVVGVYCFYWPLTGD